VVAKLQERARVQSGAGAQARELKLIELVGLMGVPGHPSDAAAERACLVEQFLTRAAGDRESLEELRAQLLEQMHRPGDRADAAAELRVVEAALELMPPAVEDPWTWQQRVRRRRRGRWRR
jgi:hypothetical protein